MSTYLDADEELRRLATCFRQKNGRFEVAPKDASEEFLLHLARMYYSEGRVINTNTLDNLAKALGNGYQSTQISRLLQEADRRQLISVHFQMPGAEVADIIKKRFNLEHVSICPGGSKNTVLRNLGESASKVFNELTRLNIEAVVAVAGGWSIVSMVKHIKETDRDISVVPLTLFSRGKKDEHTQLWDAPFVAMELTSKSHCSGTICAVPPMPQGGKDALTFTDRLFEMCPALGHVIGAAEDADIIFSAVASLRHDGEFVRLYEGAGVKLDKLVEMGCIGHLNFSAIDKDGNDLSEKIMGKRPRTSNEMRHPFLAAMGLKYFQAKVAEKKSVVLVAAGLHKISVIRAVLNARAANYLVTDIETGKGLGDFGDNDYSLGN